MIDFLSPLYLIAGAAAAIPLFIHLMRRRIGTRIEFPAVRYLARAERENSRKLRLRNLLLMLLRLAAVVLLVAAAARPVARVPGGGHAPTALAIVLDNSLSTSTIMGGRPVLENLKIQAAAVASRAEAEDRLWVVTADGAVRGGGKSAVLDAVSRTEPLASAGELDRAFARAASLVRAAPTRDREVVVITDAQASSWRATRGKQDVRIVAYAHRGEPPANRAVVKADGVPTSWTPRGSIHAQVNTPDSAIYRISLEGRTLARGTIARDEEIIVRAAPAERGWTAGAVEVEPDELRGDDTRYFAVRIGAAPGVRVQPSLGIFASSAVDALAQAERLTAGDDISIVSADEAVTLPALLVAPADPVRAGAANRALERLGVPWRLGSLRRGRTTARSLSTGEQTLDGVMVTERYSLLSRPAKDADTMATAGGEPWIVAGNGYVLVASPLKPEATELPVKAAFVPWLGDVLSQRLSNDAGVAIQAEPGGQILRPPRALALELPDGERAVLKDDSIQVPVQPGVYFLARGESRIGALVVNSEPAESNLERLSMEELRTRLAANVVLQDGSQWDNAVFASSPRRPIVLPLLFVALVTLVVESAVAGAGHKRTA